MTFPILKYLALSEDPVTPYMIENARLDVLRNGKMEKARIDKPTVFKALRLLEEAILVRPAEQKRCQDGRVRKKYIVTPRGVVALLQRHREHLQISKLDIRNLAENHKHFLPLIFGKWDYFIQQQVEDLAFVLLLYSARQTASEVDVLEALADRDQDRSAWLLMSHARQDCVHRHNIYATMLIDGWSRSSEDPNDSPWLRAIMNDKALLDMAQKEVARLRLIGEMRVPDWDSILKTLNGSNNRQWPVIGEAPWETDSDRLEDIKAAYRCDVAARLDEGKPLISFDDWWNGEST